MNHESMFPWKSKIDRAIWRGLTTGPQHVPFDDLPRAKLVKKSMGRPDIIDAGFGVAESIEANDSRECNPF
jgi:hypothetical protein